MKTYPIKQIEELVGGELTGNEILEITSPEEISRAAASQITFIGHKKFEKLWADSKAVAAVVKKDISIEPGEGRAFIKVDDPDLAMQKILLLFMPPPPEFERDIHHSATVDSTAVIGSKVRIGANCYVGPDVVLGDGCILYPNVTVLDKSEIGAGTVIWSGAVVRERCRIGKRCIIHPNAVIGADGFGFRPCKETGLAKIPHIGDVVIGDDVEIGANSCVDRGKFSSTVVGNGCKIDNLVQIAHNSVLGKFCIMAGNSGLAGSVTLGDGVVIGGSVSVKDHLTIGSGAMIGAGSGVAADVEPGKTVLGYPAVDYRTALKQWAILKKMAES